MFVADNGYKLIRTTNDGVQWNATTYQVNNPVSVVCKPNDANHVLVATYLGNPQIGEIRLSTGGGMTSNFILKKPEQGMDPRHFGMSSVDPQKVFLGTKYVETKSSLRKSFDGGATWYDDDFFKNLLTGQHAVTHALFVNWHPTDAGMVLVAGSAFDLPYADAPDVVDEDVYHDSSNYDPINKTGVVLLPFRRGVFQSINSGANWSNRTSSANSHSYTRRPIQGKNISAVAYCNSGNSIIASSSRMLGAVAGLWVTSELDAYNKQGWDELDQYTLGSVTSITVNGSDVYVTNNVLGIFHYTTVNNSFVKVDGDNRIFDRDTRAIAMHSNAATDVFAVAKTSVYRGTTSSNSSWYTINTGIVKVNTGIVKVNASSVTAAGTTLLAVSRDFSGISKYTPALGWRTLPQTDATQQEIFSAEYVSIDPNNSNYVYAAGTYKQLNAGDVKNYASLFRSSDAGATWSLKLQSINNDGYKFYGVAFDPKLIPLLVHFMRLVV